jgi:hypothetical protein
MYCGDPSTRSELVTMLSPSIVAMPKSVSRTRPSSASSTLAGLTSRCPHPGTVRGVQCREHGQADGCHPPRFERAVTPDDLLQ